jgi:hypothetical protein
MYTSYIGFKFLELYNRKTKNHYTAEEFFDKEMFPLFFENDRHLMHVSNSPFFQSPSEKELKQTGLKPYKLQYHKLQQKIEQVSLKIEIPDASIYVGYAAKGPDQVTAGQVSNIILETSKEELYASWIGNALSVRVAGSQCLLIDSEPLLWHLYEGWKEYREFIEDLKQMEGRQIETWNGYWVARGALNKMVQPPDKGNKLETIPWVEVLAKLLRWHSKQTLLVYIFSLGQTNTTYGFINISFPELQRLSEGRHTFKKIMLNNDEGDDSFWKQYEPDFSLREACQLGEIGIRALRPKDFVKLMEGNYSSLKLTDKNKQSLYNIQIWIKAMLNNKSDLQQLAKDLAFELVAAETKGSGRERSKVTDNAHSKALLEAKGLISFIEALTSFLEKNQSAAGVCREVADQSLRIPGEQFPLFKALVRFEYAIQKNK